MKLSVELFKKTLHQLKSEVGGPRVEKRAAPRVGLRTKITLTPVRAGGTGRPIEVWTRDISRCGLGIISPRKLKVGDNYLLTLPHEDADDEGKPLALYCTVRCAHLLAPDIYAVGFSFEDMRTMQFPAPRAKDSPAVHADTPAMISKALAAATDGDEERIRKAILG